MKTTIWGNEGLFREIVKPRPVIIFIHIRRTGGTSLNITLINNFGLAGFYCTTGENKGRPEDYVASIPHNSVQILEGHFTYGFHKYFPSYKYITVLRNPVDRAISYYQFIRMSRWHWLHQTAMSLALQPFISLMPANEQANAIAGSIKTIPKPLLKEVARKDISPISLYNHCLLEQAKRNLQSMTFGLTERFDKSLEIFKARLELTYIDNNIYNSAPKPKIDIQPDVIKYIENRNIVDMKLYEYASSLFDKQLS